MRRRHFGDDFAHQLARHRIDRRFADGERQAGLGDGADAGTGAEHDAAAGCAASDTGNDGGAVGHVRIVAGVLDDAGFGKVVAERLMCECERRLIALRQPDRHRIRENRR